MKNQSSSGQLALDLTARPPADTTARFVEYLRSEPSAHEVAQELVLGYLGDFQARASVISVVQSDATLRLAGGFGLPDQEMEKVGGCSLWADLPAARAVREQQRLVMRAPEETHVLSGLGSHAHSIVAAPLMTTVSVLGALCVCFSDDRQDLSLAVSTLEALADVYVLYLLTNSTHDSNRIESAHNRGNKPVAPPVSLSTRQLAILELLSDGLTYDQIAARIGYSHSTVRMELMHVYRFFGVSSRREAVSVAVRRGLVTTRIDGARVLAP